ncbi:hypothetical protein BA190_26905 [Labrys sp. WJW]|uniref:hypothetical protein n=1 Tax=Labrys sp. WJW TaxID=1737983 RepID=UPI00082A1019|nr:hypothetical protein [Labrys sp. WJW]OCC01845.1 hypothetical protein BA190_26905 [Labrys sp. WJW]
MTELFGMYEPSLYLTMPEGVGDTEAERTRLERLKSGAQDLGQAASDVLDADKRAAAGQQFRAASDQRWLLDSTAGAENRRIRAYDAAIQRIRQLTGVKLENPMFNAYDGDVLREAISAGVEGGDLETLQQNTPELLRRGREVFDRKVAELRKQRPEWADAPELTYDIEGDQARIAQNVVQASEAAQKDESGNATLNTLAGFGGGFAGDVGTPEFSLGLLAGGPAGTIGRGLVTRVIAGALADGAVNAGVTAIAQPTIQADRKSLGLENGDDLAWQNVKDSFVYGAIGGGLLRAGIEVPGYLAGRRARAAPGSVNDAALRGHDVSAAISEAVLQPPAGVARSAAQGTFAEGLDAAVNPGSPRPFAVRPTFFVTKDAEAAIAGRRLRGTLDDAEWLRSDRRLIDTALASEDPVIRATGAMADLSAYAWRRVRDGDILPDHGLAIALTTDDATLQSLLASRLREAGPISMGEARQIITDELSARGAVSSAHAMLGLAGEVETPSAYAERALQETMPDQMRRLSELENAVAGNQRELGVLRAESLDNERFGATRAAFIQAGELDAKYQRLLASAEKATSEVQRAGIMQRADAVQNEVRGLFGKLDPAVVARLEELEAALPLRETALRDALSARDGLAAEIETARQGYIREFFNRPSLERVAPARAEASPPVSAPASVLELTGDDLSNRYAIETNGRSMSRKVYSESRPDRLRQMVSEIQQFLADGKTVTAFHRRQPTAIASVVDGKLYDPAGKEIAAGSIMRLHDKDAALRVEDPAPAASAAGKPAEASPASAAPAESKTAESPPATAAESARATPARKLTVKDHVPMVGDDGAVVMATPEMLATAGERNRHLSGLVQACRL